MGPVIEIKHNIIQQSGRQVNSRKDKLKDKKERISYPKVMCNKRCHICINSSNGVG